MNKKALLIGINYIGTSNELHGCIDDIMNVKSMLIQRNFKEEDIIVLTDNSSIKPTRQNIYHAMRTFLSNKSSFLYIHYSGHGTSVRDTNGDEVSGLDSAIVPLDFQANGFIIDDDIKSLLDIADSSSIVFGVLDSCHSGTCFDLMYNVSHKNKVFSLTMDKHHTETKAFVSLLSGCKDEQTSADAYINKQAQGALTFAYLKVLKDHNYNLGYDEMLADIREVLHVNNYDQKPQLSFGKYVNLHQQIGL